MTLQNHHRKARRRRRSPSSSRGRASLSAPHALLLLTMLSTIVIKPVTVLATTPSTAPEDHNNFSYTNEDGAHVTENRGTGMRVGVIKVTTTETVLDKATNKTVEASTTSETFGGMDVAFLGGGTDYMLLIIIAIAGLVFGLVMCACFLHEKRKLHRLRKRRSSLGSRRSQIVPTPIDENVHPSSPLSVQSPRSNLSLRSPEGQHAFQMNRIQRQNSQVSPLKGDSFDVVQKTLKRASTLNTNFVEVGLCEGGSGNAPPVVKPTFEKKGKGKGQVDSSTGKLKKGFSKATSSSSVDSPRSYN